jgi:hypothetical protein
VKIVASAAVALMLVTAADGGRVWPSADVTPSGPTIPENLLRIELQLSAPLVSPLNMSYVHLVDESGRRVEDAFLDLALPTADGMRVTLLLHPARVKAGVGANIALGRALLPGTTVTLAINDPALARPVAKVWRVEPYDSAPPRPALWRLDLPRTGGRAPLVVRLDASMSSSAVGLIAVRAPNGRRLSGTARLVDAETVWRFVPEVPWIAGRYALVTHPDLEDAAGNRACSPFEAIEASRARCDQETTHTFVIADSDGEKTHLTNNQSRYSILSSLLRLSGTLASTLKQPLELKRQLDR